MTYKDLDYQKKYAEKNKEKLKEYRKKYRQENKEKRTEYDKKYREEKKEKRKEYREKNKEKLKQQEKEYWQTEAGKKSMRLKNWRRSGLKHENYDEIYEYYLNCKNCENCNVELTDGNTASNRKCMDHSHITGEFRNILCATCNTKRREDNF